MQSALPVLGFSSPNSTNWRLSSTAALLSAFREENPPITCKAGLDIVQSVKNLPAMQETWVQFLCQADHLEKETATFSSIPAWKIQWTERPGRLQSLGSQESDMTERLSPQDHLQLFSASLHSQRHPQVQRPLLLSLFSCQDVSAPFVTWTVARQAPLSMRFPKQEYWSGVTFPSPGVLPDPGIEPTSVASVGWFFTTEPPRMLAASLGKSQGWCWASQEKMYQAGVLCNEDGFSVTP